MQVCSAEDFAGSGSQIGPAVKVLASPLRESPQVLPAWQRQLGSALPVLHGDERFQVLARVDGDAADDEPLLVALLAVAHRKARSCIDASPLPSTSRCRRTEPKHRRCGRRKR